MRVPELKYWLREVSEDIKNENERTEKERGRR